MYLGEIQESPADQIDKEGRDDCAGSEWGERQYVALDIFDERLASVRSDEDADRRKE